MTFYVGQKVVCIAKNWWTCSGRPWPHAFNPPLENQIYVIRGYSQRPLAMPTVYIIGIILPPGPDGHEEGFAECGFRPLMDRKTDISVFQKMLKDERVTA